MKTGLDRLASLPELVARLRRERVALLAHSASVTHNFVHLTEVLGGLGVSPRILFGPEHGFAGEAQDMVGVRDSADARGARVVSLYGSTFESLSPKPSDLEEVDVVVIDLQDVGARYYTYVWTAVLLARACKKAGVRVLVLDRPNPLGGAALEGQLQREGFTSFVGLEPVPVRHAATLGDLVAWRADKEGFADLVSVVEFEGVAPDAHATAWDRAFVMPSPNMPTYETALVYPGGCLLEGTNLSDGRGTTRPFEITGAPWLDGRRLARALADTELPGFVARPISFLPTFHKHVGLRCGGVQIHVTEPRAFRPYATYVALVALAHHAHPEHFRFRTEPYEFVSDIPAFDLLTGSDETRRAIERGDDARAIAEGISAVGPEALAVARELRASRRKVHVF